MQRRTAGVRVVVGVVLALLVSLAPAAAEDAFKVIVNAKIAGRVVSKATLAQIYLGRVKRWRDGRPVAAVDLPSTSPVRAAFSQAVLGMSVLGIRSHWMRSISSGERPPLTRTNDAAVIAFVAAEAGGVGYVSEAAALPDTVKVVTVE